MGVLLYSITPWHVLTGHLFPTGRMGTLQFPKGVSHQPSATVAFRALSPSALHFPICKMDSEPTLRALWRVRGNEMMDAKSPLSWSQESRVREGEHPSASLNPT